MGRVRTLESYYIPDLYVLPMELVRPNRHRRDLEVWDVPLPLVAEFRSPSTGDYEVSVKLEEYKRRGDAEIWLIHPYDRTLTAWRRQTDGTYVELLHTAAKIQLIALPGVVIDLDTFFD